MWKNVGNYRKKNNIGFLNILFDRLKNLTDKANPTLAEFQESYLIKNATYLKDKEAYYKLQDVYHSCLRGKVSLCGSKNAFGVIRGLTRYPKNN